MRRTYRDGTRTLCPCPNSLAPLPDFFLFQSLFARKKRCCACSCLCSIHREQDHALPASRGKTPGSQNFRAGPAQTPFHKTRADVPLVQPPKPPCCLSCPLRCAQEHYSEATQGITAKQALVQGGQDGAYAASDKLPARGLCPCPDCLLGGERRRWVTLGQQVLQTVRLPDYWFDNWFDNQASAVHAQAHQSPRFQLQLCQKAGRNGQQHGITDLFQRACSIVVPMMISLCAFCPGVQDSVRELSRDRQGLGRQPCSPCCQPAP